MIMSSIVHERDEALELVQEQLPQLSSIYKECYLSKGRGALVLHSFMLQEKHKISAIDYNTKDQSLDLFDNISSRSKLRDLIDNYDAAAEGILILVAESGASWFVTVKLPAPQ
jgi:hypothetical protein